MRLLLPVVHARDGTDGPGVLSPATALSGHVQDLFRWVKVEFMASEPVRDARRTAETMHDTAEALERAEQALHCSADASPDDATAERLDRLGDAVTAEARDIARRADNLSPRAGTSPG